MKKLIDDKGRIFGKINIIDFIIVLVALVLIPAFYVGQKLMREFYSGTALYDRTEYSPSYEIKRKCPNCGAAILIEIKKGVPATGTFPYKTTCRYCKCEVMLKFQDE